MTHWAIIGHFFHGLTFFTLGLTVVFLQYRSSRILLARQLAWLGVFAMCEAVVAWNTLLNVVVPSTFLFPQFMHPALLGVGYAYLLAFGIRTFLVDELPQARRFQLLVGLNALWFALCLLALAVANFDITRAAPLAEILVRYFLALPGGIVTAIGMRRQSYQSLDPQLRRRIRRYLQLTEAMVAAFGVLNLILVPASSIFPASLLNTQTLAPWAVEWLWVVVGTGLTLGLTRTLTSIQMEIEHWIEGVERLQALAVDRERIGRDLHDGIIQSIYASGLLLESIRAIIPTDPERAQAHLSRVMDNLNETIQDIRRYIFDLRSDMPDDQVPSGVERLLRDFRINTLLETEFEVTGEPVNILSVERRRHIFQIVREALTNTAKHAKARWVKIHLNYTEEDLDITISDDGVGMETLLVSKGYGLRNIRERVRMLDGTLRIESAPGEGVTFNLMVPY